MTGAEGSQDRVALPIQATGYARIHVPDDAPDPAPALIAVHGYGQPAAEMLAYARSVAPAGAVVIAPEGPSAFYRRARTPGGAAKGGVGHGWIADPDRGASETRNTDLIAHALAAARVRHPIDAQRILVMGYSQGAAVATHFAIHGGIRVAGVLGLAGGIPATWRPQLAALADTPVRWVSGSEDVSYPAPYVEALLADMAAVGVQVDSVVLQAEHDLLEPARGAVRTWLAGR